MFSPDYKALTDKATKVAVNVEANRKIWDKHRKGNASLAKTRDALTEHASGIEDPQWYDRSNSGSPTGSGTSSYERDVRVDSDGSRSEPLARIRGKYARIRKTRQNEGRADILSRVRDGRGDPKSKSQNYSRVSSKLTEVPGLKGVEGLLWRVKKDARDSFNAAEVTTVDYYKVLDAKAFRKAILESSSVIAQSHLS